MARTSFKGPIRVTGTGTSSNAGNQTIAGTLTVGSAGSAVKAITTGTVAVNPASIGDNDVGETTVTLTGVAAGDIVILVPPAAGITAGLMAGEARVTAADTVKVRIVNASGGSVDEASANWTYLWFDLT